jgi:hypothetical protein
MEILRDKNGKPQGVIREIAGGQERLYDLVGHAIATYRPRTNYTYDNNGSRIGSGNRLAGLVEDDE